ncbi:hypothetical protein ANCCAN_00334 [Ancylostoma caninum]|uniref:Uncharacterized protein n=1 Tax=Ancylostoma caninum TaxID=29170 RepID=A0A368H9L0_ANCCA|nr:hypothetical protein ANCCAN_00334 [Ancylostoma caninum]
MLISVFSVQPTASCDQQGLGGTDFASASAWYTISFSWIKALDQDSAPDYSRTMGSCASFSPKFMEDIKSSLGAARDIYGSIDKLVYNGFCPCHCSEFCESPPSPFFISRETSIEMFRCQKFVIIPYNVLIPPDQCTTTHTPLASGFATTNYNLEYSSTEGASTVLQHRVEYTTSVTTSSVLSTSAANKNSQQSTELPRSTSIIDISQQDGYNYSYTVPNTSSSAETVTTSNFLTSLVQKTYTMSDIPTSSNVLVTTLYSATAPFQTVEDEISLSSKVPSSESLLGSTSVVSSFYYPVHNGTMLDSSVTYPTVYSQNGKFLSSESPSQGTSYQYGSNYESTTSEIMGKSETTFTQNINPSVVATTESSDSELQQAFTSSFSATVESSRVTLKMSTSDSSSMPKSKEASFTKTIATSPAAALKSSDATLPKKYTSIPSAKVESGKPTPPKLFTSHSSATAKSSAITLNGKTTGSSTAFSGSEGRKLSMKHTSISSAKVESSEATPPKIFTSDFSATAKTSRITLNGKTTAISAAILESDVSRSSTKHTSSYSTNVESSKAILREWSTSDPCSTPMASRTTLTTKSTSTSVVISESDGATSPIRYTSSVSAVAEENKATSIEMESSGPVFTIESNSSEVPEMLMSSTSPKMEPNETTFRNSLTSGSSTTPKSNESTPAKKITSNIAKTSEPDDTTSIEISTLNSDAYWVAHSSQTMFSYDMKQSSDSKSTIAWDKRNTAATIADLFTSERKLTHISQRNSPIQSTKRTLPKEVENTSTSTNSVVVEREDGPKVYSSEGTLQTFSTQSLNSLWNASTREVSLSHIYGERTLQPEGDRATPSESSAYMKGSAQTFSSEVNMGALKTTVGGVELTSYSNKVNIWVSTDANIEQQEIETTDHASFGYSRLFSDGEIMTSNSSPTRQYEKTSLKIEYLTRITQVPSINPNLASKSRTNSLPFTAPARTMQEIPEDEKKASTKIPISASKGSSQKENHSPTSSTHQMDTITSNSISSPSTRSDETFSTKDHLSGTQGRKSSEHALSDDLSTSKY